MSLCRRFRHASRAFCPKRDAWLWLLGLGLAWLAVGLVFAVAVEHYS